MVRGLGAATLAEDNKIICTIMKSNSEGLGLLNLSNNKYTNLLEWTLAHFSSLLSPSERDALHLLRFVDCIVNLGQNLSANEAPFASISFALHWRQPVAARYRPTHPAAVCPTHPIHYVS